MALQAQALDECKCGVGRADAEGMEPLPGRARLNLAREMARTMDRLLVEEKSPEDLWSEPVLDQLGGLAVHWQHAIRLFARVNARWQAELAMRGQVDAATRRNMLFDRAARRWKEAPPPHPVVAAGVTSAALALARLLRVIAELPQGAVVLPDLDRDMSAEAWDELGRAGAADEPGGAVFAADDALTHPQYHLKLLLGRMGVNREEVQPWHRRGIAAAEPARSRAISSLFLPPQASRGWAVLEAANRRLAGVRPPRPGWHRSAPAPPQAASLRGSSAPRPARRDRKVGGRQKDKNCAARRARHG
jgi:ATP-dependent helicase/nuclease subunit B